MGTDSIVRGAILALVLLFVVVLIAGFVGEAKEMRLAPWEHTRVEAMIKRTSDRTLSFHYERYMFAGAQGTQAEEAALVRKRLAELGKR